MNVASCLQDLDLASLRTPPCALASAPTATLAQPVLVPESINNLSICAYLFGPAQLEHNMTMPADLSSSTTRGIPGFESEYYDA